MPLTVGGREFRVTCVSMGNPHCVTFVDEPTDDWVLGIGPKLEVDPRFPKRVNCEFVKVLSRSELRQRTWERGSGETLACGTGACAVCVAGVLTGRTDRNVVDSPAGRRPVDRMERREQPRLHDRPGRRSFQRRLARLSRPVCGRDARPADVARRMPTHGPQRTSPQEETTLPPHARLLHEARRPGRRQGHPRLDAARSTTGPRSTIARSIRCSASAARGSTSSGTNTSCSRSALRGHCHLSMLLSQHGDADILARVAYHFGFDCVRGSTYRGGAQGDLGARTSAAARQHLTITPDGPRGPRRQLAQGPIYLASRLQLPLVVMGFGYDRPWRMQELGPIRRAAAVLAGPRRHRPADHDAGRPRSRRPGAVPAARRAAAQLPDRRSGSLGRRRHPQGRRSRHPAAIRPPPPTRLHVPPSDAAEPTVSRRVNRRRESRLVSCLFGRPGGARSKEACHADHKEQDAARLRHDCDAIEIGVVGRIRVSRAEVEYAEGIEA